jgi:hypothetical protein
MPDHRKLAERCLQLAISAKDQRNRRALLDLASEWLELADRDAKTAELLAAVEALKRPAN